MNHSKLYQNELTHLGYGKPVWEPNPDTQYDCIRIGDVGYFENDQFIPLFNILPPTSDDLNRGIQFSQPNFQPLVIPDNLPTVQRTNPLEAGVYGLESSLTFSASVGVDSTGSVLQGESSLSFTNEKGAALILPSEACREDTMNRKLFKDHMLKHYREWYTFALTECHRDIELCDLILVTGCDLTRQWAMAAYFRRSRQISAALTAQAAPVAVANFSLSAGWSTTQPMNTRRGPPQALHLQVRQDDNEIQNDNRTLANNQCIFLRGFYLKERIIWGPRVMKAGAGYHDPGKYGPEEEGVEGLLADEDVTVESLLPPNQDKTFISVLLDYMLEESDADIVIANDSDLWPFLQEAANPENLRDVLKRMSPLIKVEDRVGSLDTQDDETALPQKWFHPWLVPVDTDGEHEELPDYEDDFLQLEWPNIIFDESTMQEIGNNKDNPPQIIEAAKALLKVSGGIKYVQSNKEDFERIIGRSSILVITLWKSYKKSKGQSLLWPTLKLRIVIEYLIETIHRIHKLLERKFKNIAKRIFGAYVIRDLGKFKKYEERLDFVAENLEKLGNIKIRQEVLDRQEQNHDDVKLSERPNRGDSLDKENTQTRADIQPEEPFAEGSNSQRKANAATAKPTNLKMKSEEENVVDQTRFKDSERIKKDVINNNDPEVQYRKDTRRSKKKGKEKETTIDEDAREATSVQGFATNQARWKKDRLKEISEDELSTANKDVRASATTTGPTKEWKPLTTPRPGQNAGRKTNPAKQAPISLGVSVTNHGLGTVTTSLRDSGYMGSINSNVGNDDSKNHFRPTGRPKKEKELPVTISGFDIENYGSGNVGNENSRWNRPLVVENYGSGYVGSENFDHSNVIPRPGV